MPLVISPKYGFSRSEFQYFEPGEKERVVEAFTCGHCCKVTKVPPRADPTDLGGYCRGCGGLICARCVNELRCDPIEKKLERAEASGRLRAALG